MKHSNPEGIDHSKEDIYNALTGNDKHTLTSFLSVNISGLMSSLSLSEDEHATTTSYKLVTIMQHPTLTDEEKILLTFELGRIIGEEAGINGVCGTCAIGPASKLMHEFSNVMNVGNEDSEDSEE